jgi:hypothetical protein
VELDGITTVAALRLAVDVELPRVATVAALADEDVVAGSV